MKVFNLDIFFEEFGDYVLHIYNSKDIKIGVLDISLYLDDKLLEMFYDKLIRYELMDDEDYYEENSLMDYIDNKFTPLEQKVIDWVLQHRVEYAELVDRGIFSADIVNYCVENKCEGLPLEWVVSLVTKKKK